MQYIKLDINKNDLPKIYRLQINVEISDLSYFNCNKHSCFNLKSKVLGYTFSVVSLIRELIECFPTWIRIKFQDFLNTKNLIQAELFITFSISFFYLWTLGS